MASLSSSLLVLFNFYVLFILISLVSSSADLSSDSPIIKLSVSPTSGYTAENVEVRCEISPSLIVSSLSTAKFDNVYLSVRTDSVKPSGIILKFEDSTDRCQVNRENVHVDVCNATLIRVHITHAILNETLQKIEYSCSKGSTYVHSSYQLLQNLSARSYDSSNTSSHLFVPSILLFISIFFLIKVRSL